MPQANIVSISALPVWKKMRQIEGGKMNAVKIAAIVLIAAGILGLVYGGFSYTKETHDVKLGAIEFSVKEKQKVNVPVWGGVGAIVVGGALLFFGSRKI
jgi:hypothetical protein